MLNVNGIGHQVRFGYNTTSEQLKQKIALASESQTTSAPASAQLSEAPKKSHKVLYTILGLAVATAAIVVAGKYEKLSKLSKIGESAQEYYKKAAEYVTTKATAALEATKGAYNTAKDSVVKHFSKKEVA